MQTNKYLQADCVEGRLAGPVTLAMIRRALHLRGIQMPISVSCECGKRTSVGDPLAGRMIRCPACGGEIYVPVPSTAPGGGKSGKPAKKANAAPAVHISNGMIALIAVAGLIVLMAIFFITGLLRVWHTWEAKAEQAKYDVTDVVEWGLKGYLSERGGYNPRDSHGAPAVIELDFFRPVMAMSMPEYVIFHGKTNQGDFAGHYHPKTGEVEADVKYGGYALAGVPTRGKGLGEIHLTGRKLNGQTVAEANGTKVQLVYPKLRDE